MDWVLFGLGLWVIGLFAPWHDIPWKERFELAAVPGVIISGLGMVAVVFTAGGVLWLAASFLTSLT